ncbi:hypothetical protein L2E82_17438 [Cichorium intybus]|uniref:Uncharacterized protein n=1 Tax=Cichorium intybus TaxID=13427 RepID=A0ACB9F968_CICIN|nr:hypothetical protein L2E82_17438 [Cichorium intybus]
MTRLASSEGKVSLKILFDRLRKRRPEINEISGRICPTKLLVAPVRLMRLERLPISEERNLMRLIGSDVTSRVSCNAKPSVMAGGDVPCGKKAYGSSVMEVFRDSRARNSDNRPSLNG